MIELLNNLDTKEVITLVSSIAGAILVLNEKARGFLLEKLNFKKNKAQITNDTSAATDEVIDKMMSRINKLGDEFVALSEENIATQKENFECKQKIAELEYNYSKMLKAIKLKCRNNCLEDV